MTGRVRKWLGSSITLSLTWGEVLALVALVAIVVLVNALWPSVPAWAFFVIGAGIGAPRALGRDLGRWLRRRRAT